MRITFCGAGFDPVKRVFGNPINNLVTIAPGTRLAWQFSLVEGKTFGDLW